MLGRSVPMCAALMDGPTTPMDIRSVVGHTGRILMVEEGSDQIRERACVLKKIDHRTMVVSLNSSDGPSPGPNTSVVLEVADRCALIQCFTFISTVEQPWQLTLQTPPRIHTLQRRRFPRVDVYMGITIFDGDHTIVPRPGQLINLSVDGAACVVAEPVAVGSQVTLNLAALGLFPAEMDAEVVRCSASPDRLWVIALQFHPRAVEQQLYLAKYVTSCLE